MSADRVPQPLFAVLVSGHIDEDADGLDLQVVDAQVSFARAVSDCDKGQLAAFAGGALERIAVNIRAGQGIDISGLL